MKLPLAILTAAILGTAAAPAMAGPDRHRGEPTVTFQLGIGDARFGWTSGDRPHWGGGHRGHYDGRGHAVPRHQGRAWREERVERRLEGQFLGHRGPQIRHSLRERGFRRIAIDPARHGFRVSAIRNGNPFTFVVARRTGRIVDAERY